MSIQDTTKPIQELSDKYELEMDTDKIEVSKLKPEVTFNRWGTEVQFKIGYNDIKKDR